MSTTPPPPGAPPPPPPGAPPPPPPVGGGIPPGVPYGGPSTSGIGPGQIVALIGGAVVLITGWLNWFDFEGIDESGSAYRFPAGFLVDNQIQDDAGISIGVLVFLAAALIVVGALVAGVRWLAIVGGAGAVVVAGLYLFQWNGLVSDAKDAGGDVSLFDTTTYMPIVTILGGLAAATGGILALTQRR